MSLGVHYNDDVACILSALAMANRLPSVAPDTREARLYRAGFQAGLQMVAEALGIEMPISTIRNPHPEILTGVSSGNLQS